MVHAQGSPPKLTEKGVRAGDRLLVFESLRPSLESLSAAVEENFSRHMLLDRGGSFVGVLLKGET